MEKLDYPKFHEFQPYNERVRGFPVIVENLLGAVETFVYDSSNPHNELTDLFDEPTENSTDHVTGPFDVLQRFGQSATDLIEYTDHASIQTVGISRITDDTLHESFPDTGNLCGTVFDRTEIVLNERLQSLMLLYEVKDRLLSLNGVRLILLEVARGAFRKKSHLNQSRHVSTDTIGNGPGEFIETYTHSVSALVEEVEIFAGLDADRHKIVHSAHLLLHGERRLSLSDTIL